MLIHKNNKALRDRHFAWPNRERDGKSVANTKIHILQPDIHGFTDNSAFARGIKHKILNGDIADVRSGKSLFDHHYHLDKIQKIVDGLQDEIVRNEKIERLEETQRNRKQEQLLNFEVREVRIIENDRLQSEKKDSSQIETKNLETIDDIKTLKLLPIKSRRVLVKSINDYYDNKQIYKNNQVDKFRTRSMHKLLQDKGRTLSNQKFTIPGIFGMPKVFNRKPSKYGKLDKLPSQNCVIKIPNQETYNDETIYFNTRDYQNSYLGSSLNSVRNDEIKVVSSLESIRIHKKSDHEHIYNQKRMKAIDYELKKYVKSRRLNINDNFPNSNKNKSRETNLNESRDSSISNERDKNLKFYKANPIKHYDFEDPVRDELLKESGSALESIKRKNKRSNNKSQIQLYIKHSSKMINQQFFGNHRNSQEKELESSIMTRKSIKSLLGLDQGIFGGIIDD